MSIADNVQRLGILDLLNYKAMVIKLFFTISLLADFFSEAKTTL